MQEIIYDFKLPVAQVLQIYSEEKLFSNNVAQNNFHEQHDPALSD